MTIKPLQPDWAPQRPAVGETPYEVKEVLGGRALFRHHCGMRMHKVFVYHREGGHITRYGPSPNSWICPVCNAREYSEDWFTPPLKV